MLHLPKPAHNYKGFQQKFLTIYDNNGIESFDDIEVIFSDLAQVNFILYINFV